MNILKHMGGMPHSGWMSRVCKGDGCWASLWDSAPSEWCSVVLPNAKYGKDSTYNKLTQTFIKIGKPLSRHCPILH